jgi:hypothetical protein
MRHMNENGVSATSFFMSFMFLLSDFRLSLPQDSTSANLVAE